MSNVKKYVGEKEYVVAGGFVQLARIPGYNMPVPIMQCTRILGELETLEAARECLSKISSKVDDGDVVAIFKRLDYCALSAPGSKPQSYDMLESNCGLPLEGFQKH